MKIISKDQRVYYVIINEREYLLSEVRMVLETFKANTERTYFQPLISQYETNSDMARDLAKINVLNKTVGVLNKIYYDCGEKFKEYYKQLPKNDFEYIELTIREI